MTEPLDRLSVLIELRRAEAKANLGASWRRESAASWGWMAIIEFLASLVAVGFSVAIHEAVWSLCAVGFAVFMYFMGREAWSQRARLIADADAMIAEFSPRPTAHD